MSGAEVHELPPPDDPMLVELARDVTLDLDRVADADEGRHWHQARPADEMLERTIPLDEYGRAPIVQVLPEAAAVQCQYRGNPVQIVAWAIDSNGDTWPMVRTATHPRPTLVRDADTEVRPW